MQFKLVAFLLISLCLSFQAFSDDSLYASSLKRIYLGNPTEPLLFSTPDGQPRSLVLTKFQGAFLIDPVSNKILQQFSVGEREFDAKAPGFIVDEGRGIAMFGSKDENLYVLDVFQQTVLRKFNIGFEVHTAPAFYKNQSGQLKAFVGTYVGYKNNPSTPSQALIIDPLSGQVDKRFDGLCKMHFYDDPTIFNWQGKNYGMLAADDKIFVFDLDQQTLIHTMPIVEKPTRPSANWYIRGSTTYFEIDGQPRAMVSYGQIILFFDPVAGKFMNQKLVSRGYLVKPEVMKFENRNYGVVPSGDGSESVIIFDLASGEIVKEFGARFLVYDSGFFQWQGHTYATFVDANKIIKFLDIWTGEVVATNYKSGEYLNHLYYFHDQDRLFAFGLGLMGGDYFKFQFAGPRVQE